MRRLLLTPCILLVNAAPAAAVTTAGPDGRVGPLPAFQVTPGAGEDGVRVVLYRNRADAASGDGGSDLVTRETRKGLRPYTPIEPGRYFWAGAAYRGSELVRSAPRKIVVRKVVELSKVRFKRDQATITGSYVWRTNAPALTHRVEVFYEGDRVSDVDSRIEHSESDRFTGETFAFRAVLSDGRPPFGSVRSGRWRVRVSIKGSGETDSASKRYRIG